MKLEILEEFKTALRQDILILIDHLGKIKVDLWHPLHQWNIAQGMLYSMQNDGLIQSSISVFSMKHVYRLTPIGQEIVDEIKYERARKNITGDKL